MQTQPQVVCLSSPYSGVYGPITDEESGEAKSFDFTNKSIRRGFIRKVFAILFAQLLVTFGFVFLTTYNDPIRIFLEGSIELLIAAYVILALTILVITLFENARRKSPLNYILLAIFTSAESLVLGATAAQFDTQIVVMSVGVTAGVCLALTLFALQTKWDFTRFGAILFVTLCIFASAVFSGIFISLYVGDNFLYIVYASVGALIFSVYLVFDIQIMLDGQHKYSISPEEYIFAALNLYLDVINLFIYIMYIIGGRN